MVPSLALILLVIALVLQTINLSTPNWLKNPNKGLLVGKDETKPFISSPKGYVLVGTQLAYCTLLLLALILLFSSSKTWRLLVMFTAFVTVISGMVYEYVTYKRKFNPETIGVSQWCCVASTSVLFLCIGICCLSSTSEPMTSWSLTSL